MIAGCKKGDRKAQEQLYRSYYKAMMGLCLRYTKNESDAVDILNGAFLKVFTHIQRYDPAQGSAYTWIRTIVVHSCLDFVKLKSRSVPHKELDQALEVHLDADALSKLEVAVLLHLIRQLPPATQAVFNLYVMEGYNHAEIGRLLTISEGTSKWHLSEARKRLQQMIRSQEVTI